MTEARTPDLRVISLGGGVQSTTLILMAARGEFDVMPDCAIFADTQWEPKAVYEHLDWLEREVGHIIPIYRVTKGNIRQACLESKNGKRFAALPFHVRNLDGKSGMLRRQCTREYKIEYPAIQRGCDDVLNRAILIGRLTADPELRYTQQGHAVTTFRIAVDRPFTNQQGERETDFFPIVTWRKLAETCAHNLNKGRLVAVEGRLQNRSFQTNLGETRWVTEIVADNVRFLDWPKDEHGSQGEADGSEFEEDTVPF